MSGIRSYFIYGEFIASVSGNWFSDITQLGLTAEPVRIVPVYSHRDIYTDGFGPNVPVDTLWNLGECLLYMTLVNFNVVTLGTCMRAAMGGGNLDLNDDTNLQGFMGPTGRPLGFGRPIGAANNNYTTIHLYPTGDSPYYPYRFLACYLNSQPLEIPLGTERSLVRVCFRVIPYQPLTLEDGTTPQEVSNVSGLALFDFISGVVD